MDTIQIHGLNFKAVKLPGHKNWNAFWEDGQILLDHISKPTRKQLWEDYQKVARIIGKDRFVRDTNALLVGK